MKCARNYKYIDIIRILSCISVLLYHLNILKGGYLAVCIFFVLSGYLSCVSASKKQFSIISYYRSRLLKIYLPLLVVVFISIFVISLFPDINWLNLKPETTSVLLGYNNFWQLNANLDYFARHINSPFIHLWYIAIMLQFDLIFPFLYLGLRKIGDKVKLLPCIITLFLSIISYLYFYKLNINQNMMASYYNTFSRMFSLLFGLFLGFVHLYYKPLIINFKNVCFNKIIYYLYFLILIGLFVFVDAQSLYFPISMLLATLISCRLINYSLYIEENNILSKFINYLSKISYEIYLVQYPVIYLFQYTDIFGLFKIPVIILLILILSCVLKFCLTNGKRKILKVFLCYVVSVLVLSGIIKYIVAVDYTNEMNQLEQQLADNEKIMKEQQEKYESAFKEQEENWLSIMEDLANEEAKLKEMVSNLSVVGVGDSIMLGAIDNLYQQFPNGYFDAQVSRTAWLANGILKNLKNRNMLGEPIVLNLGANGDCPEWCKIEIMETIGERKVFWLNTTNYKYVNEELNSLSLKYDNLYIIDWYNISKGHLEYFVADRIHLTTLGKEVYTQTIYDSIYNIYLDEYNEKKEQIMSQYEKESKSKITFYGNDLLINAYDDIHSIFQNSSFITNKNFDFSLLKQNIEQSILNNTLNYNVVLVFDNNFKIKESEYYELIEMCKDYNLYIVLLNDNVISSENVKIINFSDNLNQNSNYLMADKIHLTDEGNMALAEVLKNVINIEQIKNG